MYTKYRQHYIILQGKAGEVTTGKNDRLRMLNNTNLKFRQNLYYFKISPIHIYFLLVIQL